jgi:arylsulfatase A
MLPLTFSRGFAATSQLAACLAFLLAWLTGHRQADAAETMAYKKADGRDLLLHIDRPADWKQGDRRPAVVFFFGGGWVGGRVEQFQPQSEHFAGRGMVGIRVAYRTIPKGDMGPPTVCCADAKSALRFVRARAAELGINPDRIAAAGGSAGGHLAAFTALVPGLDDPADDLSVSCRPDALLLFNPVFHNGPEGWGHDRLGDRFREFSPAHHITAKAPPTAIFTGDRDRLLPMPIVIGFAKEMKQAGVRCDLNVYPQAGHGFFNQEPHLAQTTAAADRFLVSLGWIADRTAAPPAAAPAPAAGTAPPSRPNFVIINIDDLGYADIGPFGSTLNRTPELDRMAHEGRRLTCFYAAPVCSPSRASLMTGCYPKRVLPIPHVLFPADPIGLDPGETTVAEVLRGAGYATAIIGKWHLGDQPEFLPNAQGFDLHFGLPYSNDMGPEEDGVKSDLGKPLPKARRPGQPPLPLLRNGKVVQRVLPDDQQSLVERYTAEAVKFISGHKDKPFFLYLPHNAVHFPLYPGKAWAGKSPHGIYADWVEEVDWSVGRILETIRSSNLAERTLVLFVSDNGGTPRALNTPLRGHKGSVLEGGMRVPALAWWPGTIPVGTECPEVMGMLDILPTFAALAGTPIPSGRRLDGKDVSPHLRGIPGTPPAHDVFHYFSGLRLMAIRKGPWKLHFGSTTENRTPAKAKGQPELYHLADDPGESRNVAAQHPDIVASLTELAEAMDQDLGRTGTGPGVRALGRVPQPKPLIPWDQE